MNRGGIERTGLAGAFGLLTVVGRGAAPTPSSLKWFPLVGAVLGLALGLVWWEAGHVWPAPVVAGLVLVLDLGLTGMLHADGLLDSADGLLPHLEPARRLEVMAEPQAGAFGVIALVGVMLLRFAGLSYLGAGSLGGALLVFIAIWTMSRALMALATLRLTYVRPGGLAGLLVVGPDTVTGGQSLNSPPALIQVAAIVASLALMVVWAPFTGTLAALAEVAAAGAVFLLAKRRIGGYTGDVLGAAGVFGETLALVFATARW